MFTNSNDEKVFQTLPGQGWRVLIDWDPAAADLADGMPRFTLEPVIAWVTAKRGKNKSEEVVITPLVQSVYGEELVLLNSEDTKLQYLAPGEDLTDAHFDLLKGEGYRKGVSRG